MIYLWRQGVKSATVGDQDLIILNISLRLLGTVTLVGTDIVSTK